MTVFLYNATIKRKKRKKETGPQKFHFLWFNKSKRQKREVYTMGTFVKVLHKAHTDRQEHHEITGLTARK